MSRPLRPDSPTEVAPPEGQPDSEESSTDSSDQSVTPPVDDDRVHPLMASALGSGLLAKQPTPEPEAIAAVAKVCPQCGTEYETGSRFCIKDGSPLRPKAGNDPLVGRVIADRYLMLARLGEGGMGRVYLAEHVKMNRQCAVKVMNPSLVNDHESVTRFAREASSAARILHPNVATVFDFGESDRIVYLVMEYVDGEPLSHILAREGHLEPRRAVDIARQIADGLSAAHELGIVHRDLKPDNVIITQARNGRDVAKIVDFGIAKAISETQQDALTRSGLVIGTPEYMSPEQLLGDPVDARADVYSLGSILFQMLTGAAAFADETREHMIRRRLHEAAPHVRDLVPELPRRLDTTIAHMLARSPADRLATAAEARDALDPALVLADWTASVSTMRRSPPLAEKTRMTAVPLTDPGLQPTMPITRQRTSWRRVGVMTSVGVVAVMGVIVYLNMSGISDTKGAAGTRAESTAVVTQPVSSTAAPQTPATDSQTPKVDSTAIAAAKGRATNARGAAPPGRGGKPNVAANVATNPSGTSQSKPGDTSLLSNQRPPQPPPANVLSPEQRAVRQPLQAYTKAFETGSVEQLVAVFPTMDKNTKSDWQNLFRNVSNIKATDTFEPAQITADGDTATLGYTLILKWRSASSSGSTNKYRAILAKKDGRWEIVSLAETP